MTDLMCDENIEGLWFDEILPNMIKGQTVRQPISHPERENLVRAIVDTDVEFTVKCRAVHLIDRYLSNHDTEYCRATVAACVWLADKIVNSERADSPFTWMSLMIVSYGQIVRAEKDVLEKLDFKVMDPILTDFVQPALQFIGNFEHVERDTATYALNSMLIPELLDKPLSHVAAACVVAASQDKDDYERILGLMTELYDITEIYLLRLVAVLRGFK